MNGCSAKPDANISKNQFLSRPPQSHRLPPSQSLNITFHSSCVGNLPLPQPQLVSILFSNSLCPNQNSPMPPLHPTPFPLLPLPRPHPPPSHRPLNPPILIPLPNNTFLHSFPQPPHLRHQHLFIPHLIRHQRRCLLLRLPFLPPTPTPILKSPKHHAPLPTTILPHIPTLTLLRKFLPRLFLLP